jgi:hypothetical protein
MGLVGFLCVTYIHLVGGYVTGVMLSPFFTMVGFAAYGKHPKNILPVMLGVFVGTHIQGRPADAPGVLFAALFGTALAPISGQFGWPFGILAGFIHLALVSQTGAFHAGMNLYNNGFAAGVIAMTFVPVLQTLTQIQKKKPASH